MRIEGRGLGRVDRDCRCRVLVGYVDGARSVFASDAGIPAHQLSSSFLLGAFLPPPSIRAIAAGDDREAEREGGNESSSSRGLPGLGSNEVEVASEEHSVARLTKRGLRCHDGQYIEVSCIWQHYPPSREQRRVMVDGWSSVKNVSIMRARFACERASVGWVESEYRGRDISNCPTELTYMRYLSYSIIVDLIHNGTRAQFDVFQTRLFRCR